MLAGSDWHDHVLSVELLSLLVLLLNKQVISPITYAWQPKTYVLMFSITLNVSRWTEPASKSFIQISSKVAEV